ncbi:MAG: hypothetical protein E3K32_04930 [wastewater metagenome]|nr:hypothetical protein [Candidatus Loosdrechtia aerotolerans]
MKYFLFDKKFLAKTVVLSLLVLGSVAVHASANSLEVAPDPRDQAFLLTPGKTFDYYCSPCHGKQGEGNGTFYTIDLKPKPRDLTDTEYMSKLTDDQLIQSISRGTAAVGKSNLCPPWGGTFSEKKIKELVQFIRGLSEQEAEKPVVAAKEQVEETTQNTIVKTSVRWAFLIVVTFGLLVGAVSELKKLRSETK